MGSFITLWAFCFALLVINLMLNGSGTEADCFDYPAGIGYNTSEDCSSNCTDYCKSQIECDILTDPCDTNYRRDLRRLYCPTCDPCNSCPRGFSYDYYPCDLIINRRFSRHDYCDPCKRCDINGTEKNFCSSSISTPPPPPPVQPAPSFNYCSNPFSGGDCKQTIFSNGNSSCFCTYCD